MMDWIQGGLWHWSPLPTILLLLIVAVGLARLLSWSFLRRKAMTHLSANIVAVLFVVPIFLLLILGWTAGILAPAAVTSPFSQRNWANRPWARYEMAFELGDGGVLEGLTRRQVVRLLGEEDGSIGGSSWVLWRPRDACDLFAPELVVRYDQLGRIDACYIEPSFWEAVILGREARKLDQH